MKLRKPKTNVFDAMQNALLVRIRSERVAVLAVGIAGLIFLAITLYDSRQLLVDGSHDQLMYILSIALALAGALILVLDSFESVEYKFRNSCRLAWGEISGKKISVAHARSIATQTMNKRISFIIVTIGLSMPLFVPTSNAVLDGNPLGLFLGYAAATIFLSQALAFGYAIRCTRNAADGFVELN